MFESPWDYATYWSVELIVSSTKLTREIVVPRRLDIVDLLEEAILAICTRVKLFNPPPSSPSALFFVSSS